MKSLSASYPLLLSSQLAGTIQVYQPIGQLYSTLFFRVQKELTTLVALFDFPVFVGIVFNA
jgi:hypothetical protein